MSTKEEVFPGEKSACDQEKTKEKMEKPQDQDKVECDEKKENDCDNEHKCLKDCLAMPFKYIIARFNIAVSECKTACKNIKKKWDNIPLRSSEYRDNYKMSLKMVFTLIQVFFFFSWTLLLGTALITKEKTIVWCAAIVFLFFIFLYGAKCAALLTNRDIEKYQSWTKAEHKGVFVFLGTLIIVGWFIQYINRSVLSAIVVMTAAYGVYCCSLSESRRIKFGLTNILLFIFGYFSSQLGHLLFHDTTCVKTITEAIFKYLLPVTGGIITKENTTWLSWGMPLFASCLIIIEWHKERVCPKWNPYTVQEIGLSDNVVRFAIIFISSLLYCCIANMKRGSIIPVMGLMFVAVYALYLKNARDLDHYVRRKVFISQNILTLIYCLITEDRKAIEGGDFNSDTLSRIGNFCQHIARVTNTILSENNKAEQIQIEYTEFVKFIFHELPVNENVYNTFGFLIGLSSSIAKSNPEKVVSIPLTDNDQSAFSEIVLIDDIDMEKSNNPKQIKRISDYIELIRNHFSDNSKGYSAFFLMIIGGVYAGKLKLRRLQEGTIIDQQDSDMQQLITILEPVQEEGEGKPVGSAQEEDAEALLPGHDLIMKGKNLYKWALKWVNSTEKVNEYALGWVDDLWTKIQ